MLNRRWLGTVIVVLAACGGSGDGTADTILSPAPTTTVAAGTNPVTTVAGAEVTTTAAPVTSGEGCAHVVGGEVTWQGETATVSATVSSADTGWDKYADAWEVRTVDGTVLGIRELAHPHENEQPFTRSLSGVDIPAGTSEVELAARDSVAGWCGDTLVIPVPVQP